MAFGAQRGFLTGSATSISTSLPIATGTPFVVKPGDLLFIVAAEQVASGNGTLAAASDGLGNAWTPIAASQGSGLVAGRAYYALVTKGGTISTAAVAANGSTNNGCAIIFGIEGPFNWTPLDIAPANNTDNTSPFDCPATGTLNFADEVVIGWGVATGSNVWTSTAPSTLVTNIATSTIAKAAANFRAVTVTTTVTPEFTGTAGTTQLMGTATFHLETAMGATGARELYFPLPRRPVYPMNMRGWIGRVLVGAPTVPPDLTQPFNQDDWPAPRVPHYPVARRGWLQPGQQVSGVAPPTGTALQSPVVTYRLPRAHYYPVSMRGFISPPTGTSPVATTAPFNDDTLFPLPKTAAYPVARRGWIHTRILGSGGFPCQNHWPIHNQSWYGYPLARRGWISASTVSFSLPLLLDDPMKNQGVTPLPPRAPYPISLRGWIDYDSFFFTAPPPATGMMAPVVTYRLPPRSPYPYHMRGWVARARMELAAPPVTLGTPVFNYHYPLPKVAPYPRNMRGWIARARGLLTPVTPTLGTPVVPPEWPLPRAPYYSVKLRGWIDFSPIDFKTFGTPVPSPYWQLPRAAYYQIGMRGWIQAGQQTSPVIPPATTYLAASYTPSVPRTAPYPIARRGWIATAQITVPQVTLGTPVVPPAWPLPKACYPPYTYPISMRGQIDGFAFANYALPPPVDTGTGEIHNMPFFSTFGQLKSW